MRVESMIIAHEKCGAELHGGAKKIELHTLIDLLFEHQDQFDFSCANNNVQCEVCIDDTELA